MANAAVLVPQLLPDDQFVFKVGERPVGMPGRYCFNLQKTLGLDDIKYAIFFNGIRDLCTANQLDLDVPARLLNRALVCRVCDDAVLAFPHLRDFEACSDPQWPVQSVIHILTKRRHSQAHAAAH
ncbi:hypothetical protein FRC12_024463 [Ceratobasidium sp. 428]|nr:hypothetical protein FRC12_024463 [Ceratobasidium sp. 428]